MNPRTPTGRDPESLQTSILKIKASKSFEINYSELKDKFEIWLSKYSEGYSNDVSRYLNRYLMGRILTTQEDVLNLVNSADKGKRHLCYSLRVLFNFLEEFELLDEHTLSKLRKVVKIPNSGSDNYVPSNEEILNAYSRIKKEETKMVFKLLAFSGIRIVEASALVSNFKESELMLNGNIAKYPLSMLRKTKNAYYAYIPKEFALELERIDLTKKAIINRFCAFHMPGKYLRKWNYNFLILNGVPESVADFIQGRVPITVGSMHYLAKVKQADEWYSRVTKKLLGIFD